MFLIFIANTQDIFSSNNMLLILGLINNSVGVSTIVLAIGMRNLYKKYSLETVQSVLFIGLILIFLKINVLSVSFFTIFLPFMTFFLTGIMLYVNWKLQIKILVSIIPFLIAIFFNYILPVIVPPSFANELIEKNKRKNSLLKKLEI